MFANKKCLRKSFTLKLKSLWRMAHDSSGGEGGDEKISGFHPPPLFAPNFLHSFVDSLLSFLYF